MLEVSTSAAAQHLSSPHLTIEMYGSNIVVRSTAAVDEGYTLALADTVNAAAAIDTVVIIDPVPVRCDDTFARDEHATLASICTSHDSCEPVEAKVINRRMIRIPTECDPWTIDLGTGRFCRSAPKTHLLHIGPESWVPVIAIVVSRTRLSALTTEGVLITSSRAHRAAGPPAN